MMSSAPDRIVLGQVVLRAGPRSLEMAKGLAIRDGRVLATGSRDEIRAMAGSRTVVVDEPHRAVVPGIHDFHLHLVGMARRRRELQLDGLTGDAILEAAIAARGRTRPGEWLRGRGWTEAALSEPAREALAAALADTPAMLYSHDSHSAWASPAALRLAGLDAETADPAGGRLERRARRLSGVLRETATDLVESVAGRLRGDALESALDEVVAELATLGVTAVADAGDTATDNGEGAYAALGDRASLLLGAASRLDGRLRVAVGFPAAGIEAAAGLGLASGLMLPGATTVRAGWAKAYADGALGSRTAALDAPYTCAGADGDGILRLDAGALGERIAAARAHGMALAVHAIGDRAAHAVLEALAAGPARPPGVPPDRVEHLQLLRPDDLARFRELDVTASAQPVHCAADRELMEACWADRLERAYPWRSLALAGARLAFGSDAPIETHNPWHGLFAATHRRFAGEDAADWHPEEGLDVESALAAYTLGPARAGLQADAGHLAAGALADVAVLDVDVPALLAADDRLAAVRSLLTLVGGQEVHRA